jgi:hypothetical protein
MSLPCFHLSNRYLLWAQMTWIAVHVLLVSPVWFVDGHTAVQRNITAGLPASATFAAGDSPYLAASSSVRPGEGATSAGASRGLDSLPASSPVALAGWRTCGPGPVPSKPWSAPTAYDIRTDVLETGKLDLRSYRIFKLSCCSYIGTRFDREVYAVAFSPHCH